jgi:cytochrome c oxidase assembly protein subunit 15
MEAVQNLSGAGGGRGSAVLTVGFGTTVAMWAVGYAGRLPGLLLPSPLILLLLLLCLIGGGLYLGRATRQGWWTGAAAGLVCGLLNLLVLGSFLGGAEPGQVVPSALWWVPGSILVSAVLAGAGAAVGARTADPAPDRRIWSAAFVRVAIGATLLLLGVGGLVTSAEAGLAVADWPTSFGYNMFLYPFSRMTGGIYYEHAHRLIGALVGLTTLVLAVFLQRVDPRPRVRALGWAALAMVVIQGVLGGLRVTELSLPLAMVHGVFAQLFFASLVALGAFTSATWRGDATSRVRATASSDRAFSVLLVGAMFLQLVLGAAHRHLQVMLIVHIILGVAVVVPLALLVGVRAWGLNPEQRMLQRLGLFLTGAIGVQLVLGLAAFAVTGLVSGGALSRSFDLVVSTAHQWFGAILLALAVLIACWNYRLLATSES